MFQVTVETSKTCSALGSTSICCHCKWQCHNIQQWQKWNVVATTFLSFSADWMTKVPRSGSAAKSWCRCLAAFLNLACLSAVKKAKGDFDDSESGVDWAVEVVRSENDGYGSSTIPGMELNFYFAVVSTRGVELDNIAHLNHYEFFPAPPEPCGILVSISVAYLHMSMSVSKTNKKGVRAGKWRRKRQAREQLNISAKFC